MIIANLLTCEYCYIFVTFWLLWCKNVQRETPQGVFYSWSVRSRAELISYETSHQESHGKKMRAFFPLPTILFSSPTVPWALATFCCSKDPLLLASISSFKSITLSEPHHHNEANMWKKKGENLQSRRKQQRRITSNQMSKNEIGWELRHFADGCLQEGTLKRQKQGGNFAGNRSVTLPDWLLFDNLVFTYLFICSVFFRLSNCLMWREFSSWISLP